MANLRIGIIGLGAMGAHHACDLNNKAVPGAELAAVCDASSQRLEWVERNLGTYIGLYSDVDKMLDEAELDGVIIATPHFSHPELAIKAFEKGLHVMVEKPAGVYTKQVREMNEAAVKSGKVFGIMFCNRNVKTYQKARELVKSGELGELKRINWIMTTHYRSQKYYDSGKWRGTWAGEGGGLLINQLPHQLDLFQWICGMPKKVRAFVAFGKYHDIDVEDDVTAYMEFDNGATGVFVASTGELPGTDRLEIVGNNGKVLVEDGKVTFWRLRVSERETNRTGPAFGNAEAWKCEIPADNSEEKIHSKTTKNWVDAILKGTPLLAPGFEGINSLQISNAMHLSTWNDNWVDLPVDEDFFYEKLVEMQKKSSRKDEAVNEQILDVSESFK